LIYQTCNSRIYTAGLGWDAEKLRNGDDVDLDVSAVVFDGAGNLYGSFSAVCFSQLENFGLKHSGDNQTGQGEGDDEQVACRLDLIPLEIQQIFFVVNIYTSGVTFRHVKNAFCRIVDAGGHEHCNYRLAEAGDQKAVVIARLVRTDSRWAFQALG